MAREVHYQEDRPPRKVYTLTEKGDEQLREWAQATPQLPGLRQPFLIQLSWSGGLSDEELDGLLGAYEEEVETQLRMKRGRKDQGLPAPPQSPREARVWEAVRDHGIEFYENELNWVKKLRKTLAG